MIQNVPDYIKNNYVSLKLNGTSIYVPDNVYLILMDYNNISLSIDNETWWSDSGHGEFAFTPGIRNEYNKYRSPIHLIWRTRPDIQEIWPDANFPLEGSGYDDDFIWWANNYGCGFGNEDNREYPEWYIYITEPPYPNTFAYDKNIRSVWETEYFLQNSFEDAHYYSGSLDASLANIIEWAKEEGFYLYDELNHYNNWPYIGTQQSLSKDDRHVEKWDIKSKKLEVLQNKLFQNYPNPFNPNTLIKYSLKESGFVSLKVYDILGNEVETLVNQSQMAGNYSIVFDGKSLPSGIYISKLIAGKFKEIKKMILLK
jgi:hypothetical protein